MLQLKSHFQREVMLAPALGRRKREVGVEQAEIKACPARFFEGVVGSHGGRL